MLKEDYAKFWTVLVTTLTKIRIEYITNMMTIHPK